ncbi:MAG TPA: DUF4265 domain-containing protein [Polyangiaceae bacterium]|nr:DUF4265 domain-containing protein [Polyangiaceae bacterium]
MKGHGKVYSRIERDADGFPPVAVERVWAMPTEGGLDVVDNIPFFARAAALGGTVAVEVDGGRRWYRATAKASANSLLRVLVLEGAAADEVAAVLERFGCGFERDATDWLFAVNVPPEASLRAVLTYLTALAAGGHLTYEGVLLRRA